VILLAAVLVLAAIGLLAAGLIEGSTTLQWASFAASALAALVVVAGEVHRNLAARRDDAEEDRPVPGRRTPERARRPDRPPSDQFPAVPPSGPPSRPQQAVAQPYQDQPYEGQQHGAQQHGEPRYDQPLYGAPPYDDGPWGSSASPEAQDRLPYAPPPGPPADEDTALPGRAGGRSTGGHQALGADGRPALDADGEPRVEEVEVTDLLVVLDLTDEVLVVDEHPRYHLAGCPHVGGEVTFAMPMVEARTDGFTPCATCAPDRNLARVERARRAR
jgi:hypothetical protein